MSKVLILSLVFPPDNVSTAHIMGDVAADLRNKGHEVVVLTTMPHYQPDPEALRSQPIRRSWPLLKRSEFSGVPVYHAAMPQKGTSLWGRLLGFFLFHSISTVAGCSLLRGIDVIIVPSPPLTIGVSAWLIGVRHRAPYIYVVQELYPDLAIGLGAISNPLLIRLLRRLEAFVYNRAEAVAVISENIGAQIRAKGIPKDKVRYIPNFVDTSQFQPRNRDNQFSREHGLTGKFVVSYAGNMGQYQDIEPLLEAAELLRDRLDIHILLVGSGVKWQRIADRLTRKPLPNVTILPSQPLSAVPDIYATSDLNFVPLSANLAAAALPSKVYRIMSCGRAVLAATDETSDLADLVRTAECGIVAKSNDAAELAEVISRSADTPEIAAAAGMRGREYVVERYSRPKIAEAYADAIHRATL